MFPTRALHYCLLGLLLALQACEQAEPPVHSLEVAAKGLHAAALADNGSLAVVGSIHHGGSFWRIQSEERLFNWNHSKGDYTTVIAADISSDNRWALTADPATMVLWNTASGEGTRYWSAPGEILDAELGPGASVALLGLSDHSAVLFDIQRGGIEQTLMHGDRVLSVAISEDGRLGLSGSEDYNACSWNLSNGKSLACLKHDNAVQLVALSPDGSLALSVSKYDRALIWHPHNGELIGELPLRAERLKRGLSFTAATFSPDNTLLLTGRPDETVQLWEIPQLIEVARWKLPKRNKWKPTSAAVLALAFSPVKNLFYAAASNGFIHQLKRTTPDNNLPGAANVE